MTSARDIEARAAEFVVQREDEAWGPADDAALADWLAQSAEHKAAFWRLEHGLEKVGRLASLRSPTPPRRRPWVRRSSIFPIAASLAAAAALGFFAIWSHVDRSTRLETAVGASRTTALADGSRVQLSTATELKASVTEVARQVWIERGEAYFEVAHDPSRPFVVHAGPRTVTVLGTKFSVRRHGEEVRVAVVEGRVRVDRASRSPDAPQMVSRGDIVIARGLSTIVKSGDPDAVEDALTWRKGMLTFDQTSLADAAAEFNRFNSVRLEVTDPEAAALRIGGAFEATNAEAFVRLLGESYGLRVERDGQVIRISG